ncbi:hypothetical protein ACFL1R_06195 [Candidatus Latescibacterota bacterium]
MPVIKRYLSDENLKRFETELKFLIKTMKNSNGELDIAIRDNYLNIYYKGNSLAKISFKAQDKYIVKIHENFFEHTNADNPEYFNAKTVSGNYVSLTLSAKKPPRRFLQKKHINQFCSKIKQVNYGEEIVFEQALITDNLKRDDLIIIDRQISDEVLRGKRMDLLALKQIEAKSPKYRFLVIEVKLGNNPELENDVAKQLEGYVEHIEKYFNDYKKCYEKHYEQKREMGIHKHSFTSIEIEKPVKGVVVVGGYSRFAQKSIASLKATFPNLQVKQFEYKL